MQSNERILLGISCWMFEEGLRVPRSPTRETPSFLIAEAVASTMWTKSELLTVETDQAVRWLATGLLTAKEGFHRLSH